MLRSLLRLLEWADKRWPPKARVTQADYDSLHAILADTHGRLLQAEKRLEAFHATVQSLAAKPADVAVTDRLTDLEAKFADLAKALAKPKQTDSEVMRTAFLRGEFPRAVSRTELEAQAK